MTAIWSMDNCTYCTLAKKLMVIKGMQFEERNINKKWSKHDLLKEVPNAKKLPQIVIDNICIGGYNELVEYFNSH